MQRHSTALMFTVVWLFWCAITLINLPNHQERMMPSLFVWALICIVHCVFHQSFSYLDTTPVIPPRYLLILLTIQVGFGIALWARAHSRLCHSRSRPLSRPPFGVLCRPIMGFPGERQRHYRCRHYALFAYRRSNPQGHHHGPGRLLPLYPGITAPPRIRQPASTSERASPTQTRPRPHCP